jgi:hypothetical protein
MIRRLNKGVADFGFEVFLELVFAIDIFRENYSTTNVSIAL